MRNDPNRLVRIKSLIDSDLRSVQGRSAPQEQISPKKAAEKIFQQRKQQLEAQDVASREQAQKQRQQRQLQHRQHLISEEARKTALKEQRQKQEAMRRQKENAEKQRIQQHMRNTISSPQEVQEAAQKEEQARNKKKSEETLLELTQLVKKGSAPQQQATLSRKDASLYSPFAHTKPFRAESQQSFVKRLSVETLNFLFAPFLLLWRTILYPYRLVRSFSGMRSYDLHSPRRQSGRQGFRETIATAPLACWHFVTEPFHLLARVLIDPLTLFVPKPHSYPRLSPLVYTRIFAQQIKRKCFTLTRTAEQVVGAVARFFAAPFLLLASIVLVPWRSMRYGTVRNVGAILVENAARLWRKLRIRSIGLTQSLHWRTFTALRAQRETSRKIAEGGRVFVVRVLRKRLDQAWRTLPSLWRGQRERIRRSLAAFARRAPQSRAAEAHKPFVARQSAIERAAESLSVTEEEREEQRENDKAREEEDKFSSVATPKTGLFTGSENSLLEDFFANEEDPEQNDEVADIFSQEFRRGEEANKKSLEKTIARKNDKGNDKPDGKADAKEAVYQEMDSLRSAMEEGGQRESQSKYKTGSPNTSFALSGAAQGVASGVEEKKRIFKEVEELDEGARAKLLQHLTRQVEEEKLR